MLNELTSVQLSEWEAYDRLDPIGEWRADFRTASLISKIVNIAQAIWGEEGVEMTVPLDFMPEWDKEDSIEPKKQQTVEEMKQVMLSMAGRQNRKIKRKKRLKADKLKKRR